MTIDTEHIAPALNKRLPAALVAAFLLQTAGALFWAGSAAQRIATIERETAVHSAAVERVIRLEEQMQWMRDSLMRIETKLDRIGGSQTANPR